MAKLLALVVVGYFVVVANAAVINNYAVAGFGNGASFAHQLHVAYSTIIQAAGLVAPAPYYCSMGSFSRDITACRVNPYLINLESSISQYQNAATAGQVDSRTSLGNDRAYIVSGSLDSYVLQSVVNQTETFYRTYIQNNYKVFTSYKIPAGHSWITSSYGNPCGTTLPPYIVNCGFDLAGDMLQHLNGNMNPKINQVPAHLHSFDQSAYGDTWQAGMSARGWVYLPGFCVNNPVCEVIVVFHGCEQNYDHIGNVFITESGFNEWAESNDIIVIYPQTIKTQYNKGGCWDTWGYTDTNFAIQSGLQMKLVHQIALNPPFLNWTSISR